jgi:two-component system sensor kinase FixL
MSAAVSLTLGVIQLVVWLRDRKAWSNLLFFVGALAIAGIAAWEIALMRTDSIERFAMMIRWGHVLVFVLVASMVGFVGLYFGTGRWWLGGAAVGVRLLSLIINFSSHPNLNYREITALKQMDFLGDWVWVVAQSVPNPWTRVGELSSLLVLVFVVDASLALWRKGDRDARRRAAVVGGGIIFFVLMAAGIASLIHAGVVRMPYLVSLPFLAIVMAMGTELSYDLLRVPHHLDEGLVAAVGAAFVFVDPNQVDEEIESWMQHMIVSLDADRITLFEFTTDHDGPARNTHQATRNGVPRVPREFSYDQLPWYLGELRAGRPVVLSDLTEELPARTAAEREFSRAHGTRAVMGFPLMVGGVIVRAIDCVQVRKARVWSEAAQNTLRLTGQIFAYALAQQQAQEQFRLTVEASPSGIILADREGRIVLVNAQTEKVFGYARKELIGQMIEVLLPERLRGAHPTDRAKFMAAPETRAMGAGRELFARRKDGAEFPVEIGLNPIQTPDGILVLAAVVDISARKVAEEEAQHHREEINRLSRVALLGEMSASIAHELNQPLSAIVSNANAAQRFMDRGDADLHKLREIMVDIAVDGRRADEVIRNIRNNVKRGATNRQRLNLNDVIMNVAHMVYPDALARSCQLKTSLAKDLPTIEADSVQIQQVLINLVGNALDAMRDTPVRSRKVEVATEQNDDGTIRVSVRDHGTGIPDEARERLFEKFFTTKEQGLGMGLAIARSTIEAHGGTIAAENVEGGGARFCFTLPTSEGSLR